MAKGRFDISPNRLSASPFTPALKDIRPEIQLILLLTLAIIKGAKEWKL
jgi:hypothetical protein